MAKTVLEIIKEQNGFQRSSDIPDSARNTSQRLTRENNLSATERLVSRLWQRMGEVYGAAWVNQYGAVGGAAFQTWCKGLADMTGEQIKVGFEKTIQRDSRYAPSLPEFRQCCGKGGDWPDARAAFVECCNWSSGKTWSHDVTRAAARKVGLFELRSLPESTTWPRFQVAHIECVEAFIRGELVIEEARPIAEDRRLTQYTKQESDDARAQLFRMLGGGA